MKDEDEVRDWLESLGDKVKWHTPLCDDNGWSHPGPCVDETEAVES